MGILTKGTCCTGNMPDGPGMGSLLCGDGNLLVAAEHVAVTAVAGGLHEVALVVTDMSLGPEQPP